MDEESIESSVDFIHEFNIFLSNKSKDKKVLPPVPTNKFELDYFNTMIQYISSEEQTELKKFELEHIHKESEEQRELKKLELKQKNEEINKTNFTIILGIGIIAIALINLGAGAEKTIDNIKIVLEDISNHAGEFVQQTAKLVAIFSNLSIRKLLFGPK